MATSSVPGIATRSTTLGALHTLESLHVNETEIQRAGFEAASARIALECTLAVLTVPRGIPKRRRLKEARKEKQKTDAPVADSSPASLPPQASADG